MTAEDLASTADEIDRECAAERRGFGERDEKVVLHDALDAIGVERRAGSRVIGLAVLHRGIEMTLVRLSTASWAAYSAVERLHETESKMVEGTGLTPMQALDACADAVEAEEGDRG